MIDRAQTGWWRAPAAADSARRHMQAAETETDTPLGVAAFWALIAYTVVMFLSPQVFIPALRALRPALLTGGVAVVLHLVDILRRGRSAHLAPEVWTAAALVTWATVTAPLTYRSGSAGPFFPGLPFYLGWLVKSAVIFGLLSGVMTSVPRLRRAAWALTLIAIPLAGTGVWNFIAGNFVPEQGRIVGYPSSMNTGEPNSLAMVLTMILPLSLALLSMVRRQLVRVFLFAVIALSMVAVVLTFSRTGFLTLGTVILIYLYRLLRRPERGWAVALIALALVSLPLLPSGYLDRLATITDVDADPTGSAQARLVDTRLALRLIPSHPIFGVGIGQNVLALNEERGPTWMPLHNVYLLYGVDLGLPGFLLFILLVAQCFNSTRIVQRQSHSVAALRDPFLLAEAIQTSLLVFAIAAFFVPNAYELHFYYPAGLAVAARRAYAAAARDARAAEAA